MNKITLTQNILRVAAVSLLALTLSPTKPTAVQKPSPLATNLLGTWMLVGEPGKVRAAPAAGSRLKFFTGRHWIITHSDPKTGVTIYHHGGTYTLKGDNYAETVEYANENTKDLIKQTFMFTIKVEGDTLTQIGIGNPWKEVWKRVSRAGSLSSYLRSL